MLHTFGRKKRNTTCGQLFSISSGFLLSLLLLPNMFLLLLFVAGTSLKIQIEEATSALLGATGG
jgi:hypothetical protein